eukprot:2995658-Pyramimonas_sp.AAC.1
MYVLLHNPSAQYTEGRKAGRQCERNEGGAEDPSEPEKEHHNPASPRQGGLELTVSQLANEAATACQHVL